LEDFVHLSENNFEELDMFSEVDDCFLIRFKINKSRKSVYYAAEILTTQKLIWALPSFFLEEKWQNCSEILFSSHERYCICH
jgi:hypothetical protein